MAPSQEENGDNLGKSFRSSTPKKNDMLSVLIRIASMRQF